MQTTCLKDLKPYIGFMLLAVIGLCSSAVHAASVQTGTWSGNGSNYSSTDGVTTVVSTYTGAFSFGDGFFSTWPNVYTPDVRGDNSHQWIFNPGSTSANQGRIVFTFPYPVTDPILHLDRLGGRSAGVTISAGFTLNTALSNGAQSLDKLSGVNHFIVDRSNTRVRGIVGGGTNGVRWTAECHPSSVLGTACGSIRVNGTFTTVVFDLQMLGAAGDGDGIELIWTYNEMSDMQPQFSNLPPTFFPGQTYSGLELICNNNGPYAATSALCSPTVDLGTISNQSCTTAPSIQANNAIQCTFDWQAPSSNGAVTFTGQTGASNDLDGGSDGAAGNNQVIETIQDTVSSAFQCPTTDLNDPGAGYATSGDGRYKDSLLWLDWNCGAKKTFQPGDVIRKTWRYGPLEVTALLSDITGEIEPYETGEYAEDRLRTFYGGVNPIGLISSTPAVDLNASYNINWLTTLDNQPIDNVIAIADAETTNLDEGLQATTDGEPWQLIDIASGSGTQLAWSNGGKQLEASTTSDNGGSFIAITDKVETTMHQFVLTSATSRQAFAYALPIGRDFGDLPASYSNALSGSHLLRRIGINGGQPTTPTAATSISLADFILDPTAPYLGAIEPISRSQASPDAGADAHPEDDGVQLPESLVPGSNVAIPVTVSGSGSGTLDAWIDWQGNGDFSGVDDQIATNVNGAGVINLIVSVPDDAKSGETFARFRWSSQSDLSTNAIAANGEVEDYSITILEPTSRISGRVFNDNGLNSATGGIAHDGEVNGDEAGLGGVAVKALDNSNGDCKPGDVLAETTTNGNGDWLLSLSVDDQGTNACLVADTPTGFRAISESGGGNAMTLGSLDNGRMTFTVPASGTTWEDINFGKVGSPLLVPNQQGDVAPGNVIFYRHQFTAATAGEVTFSLANPTSTPDSPAWSQQAIRDPSCSGEADFSEPLTVNVEAEEQLCLLVRIFAPANASAGAQHSVELTATQTLANTSVTDSAAVTDITRVQTGQLGLEKNVRNLGPDGDGTSGDFVDSVFTTRNQGEPCDVLRYEIRYTNGGSTPIADLEVNDATPAYTSLAAGIACPTSFPDNLTGCTENTPDGANSVGYQGSVAWQFDGQLAPGAQGTVSYDVRIQGGAGQCP